MFILRLDIVIFFAEDAREGWVDDDARFLFSSRGGSKSSIVPSFTHARFFKKRRLTKKNDDDDDDVPLNLSPILASRPISSSSRSSSLNSRECPE